MRTRSILLATAGFVVCSGMVAVYQSSWKGMLQAQPALRTLSTDAKLINLTGFRDASVLVEELPDALKDSLTRQDIEAWAANRLKNMGVRLVSFEDQISARRAADVSTDERALAAYDRSMSHVYVNLTALRSPNGTIFANLSVECKRGVFVHPGYFTLATVWERGGVLGFGSNYDAKMQVRDALNKLLNELERDWKICNR